MVSITKTWSILREPIQVTIRGKSKRSVDLVYGLIDGRYGPPIEALNKMIEEIESE